MKSKKEAALKRLLDLAQRYTRRNTTLRRDLLQAFDDAAGAAKAAGLTIEEAAPFFVELKKGLSEAASLGHPLNEMLMTSFTPEEAARIRVQTLQDLSRALGGRMMVIPLQRPPAEDCEQCPSKGECHAHGPKKTQGESKMN